jgi:hypothetical protein
MRKFSKTTNLANLPGYIKSQNHIKDSKESVSGIIDERNKFRISFPPNYVPCL